MGDERAHRSWVFNFLMTSSAGPKRAFHMVGAQESSPLSPPRFGDVEPSGTALSDVFL